MSSIWSSSLRLMGPQWSRSYKNLQYWLSPHSKTKVTFPIFSSSSIDDNTAHSKQPQLGYDPSEELLGLAIDLQPRKFISAASRARSWIGPNGQYIRELPCPSCRGRGYTPCSKCGIERSHPNCSLCNGKGVVTCHQCNGDCVIWEESIDERPWEKAQSVSPLKVKEDAEVDNLDIKLDVRRKTKRVYRSSAAEVNLKISRSLKSLNAKTGIFSKRMKMIHNDPVLRAQRVAAIKKTKGTEEARRHASETMKRYFSDPENRRKRSVSMIGVKFYCRNCGKEGHRRNYCPELTERSVYGRFKCRLCGEEGHNRRTCLRSKTANQTTKSTTTQRSPRCKICDQSGHNKRTCPKLVVRSTSSGNNNEEHVVSRRIHTCGICQKKGHNTRTCPNRTRQ